LIRESARPYVVVNLYATYCKPCIKEIPELIKLKTDLNSDAEVLFISVDDEKTIKSGLAGFLHDHQMDFQTYYYPQDSVSKYVRAMIPNWNRQIPLNMVFTQNGHLIEHTGMTDKDEIEMIINQHKDFHN
jgi:thiol-disulfide isomerase/thioredoxin